MDKKIAMEIVQESHKAQEILFNLFSEYLSEEIKKDKNKDDLEEKIYRGIFTSYHTIMSSIQDEIFKEFPDIKDDFNESMEKKSKLTKK